MFLTPSNLAPYLLARGLVHADDIVQGDFMVVEAGRRNRNHKIFRGERPGLFIKQVPAVMPELLQCIHREAACYQLIQERPDLAGLAELTPSLRDYDPRQHTLTVDLIDPSENLNEHHHRVNGFPVPVGALLGRALATAHDTTARMLSDPGWPTLFPRTPHWILSLPQRAESSLRHLGPASQQVVALVRQSPVLSNGLALLQALWQPRCLIHGDLKFDNLLLQDPGDGPRLRIIDWELADVGDSAWDVAGVLAAYAQAWLLAVPGEPSRPGPPVLHALAPFPLEATWPALRAFWDAYACGRGFTPEERGRELLRCVGFAGARLVLTALEFAQGPGEPGPIVPRFVSLAQAVFAAPQRAAVELFGFEIAEVVPS
ncbi:phosphotransferase family protein [Corallococcus exiguus]|uniref:phosphotransferase family protein n=1 Tax=Corallococcus exiguus TaxID=83462 RepID=UPI00149501EB|nr:aminoglycoside phosphotransferase family protein [Corallococcus exiguus]NPD26877.1 aminoglycoside phosphotransferase family protein [Corallococcus exiguus]NRD51002.1 aminoglycoside phosphotransferase family protein [Corallococcus exiguus]